MRARWLAAFLMLTAAVAAPLRAQQADSARVGVASRPGPAASSAASTSVLPLADSISRRPPISPGRAFLESALVPGWGQATLHRSTAGTIFTVVEAISVAMMIQSRKELAQARRFGQDSIVDHYEPPAEPGGAPVPVYLSNQFAARIKPRKQAVEDWTALLIFNHLLAGADAFVAAHLWDVPVEVTPGAASRGARLRVRVPW